MASGGERFAVALTGGAPWGFRLQGGDRVPLLVSKIRKKSKAHNANIHEGDVFLKVNGRDCLGKTHAEVMGWVDSSGGTLSVEVLRGGSVQMPQQIMSMVPQVQAPPPQPQPQSMMNGDVSRYAGPMGSTTTVKHVTQTRTVTQGGQSTQYQTQTRTENVGGQSYSTQTQRVQHAGGVSPAPTFSVPTFSASQLSGQPQAQTWSPIQGPRSPAPAPATAPKPQFSASQQPTALWRPSGAVPPVAPHHPQLEPRQPAPLAAVLVQHREPEQEEDIAYAPVGKRVWPPPEQPRDRETAPPQVPLPVGPVRPSNYVPPAHRPGAQSTDLVMDNATREVQFVMKREQEEWERQMQREQEHQKENLSPMPQAFAPPPPPPPPPPPVPPLAPQHNFRVTRVTGTHSRNVWTPTQPPQKFLPPSQPQQQSIDYEPEPVAMDQSYGPSESDGQQSPFPGKFPRAVLPPLELQLHKVQSVESDFPSTPDSTTSSMLRKKIYSDSSFYATANDAYPTIQQQMELCRKVARSLTAPQNTRARGAKMFARRVKRASNWTFGGPEFAYGQPGSMTASDYANMEDFMDEDHGFVPKFQFPLPSEFRAIPRAPPMPDFMKESARENVKRSYTTEAMEQLEKLRASQKMKHDAIPPDVCFSLSHDLKSSTGRAGKKFAARRARMDKYTVDENNVKAPPSAPNLAIQARLIQQSGATSQIPSMTGRSKLEDMIELGKAQVTPWDAAATNPAGNLDEAFTHLTEYRRKVAAARVAGGIIETPVPVQPKYQPTKPSPLMVDLTDSGPVQDKKFNTKIRGWTSVGAPGGQSAPMMSPGQPPSMPDGPAPPALDRGVTDAGQKDYNRKIKAWISPAEREQPKTFNVHSPFTPAGPASPQPHVPGTPTAGFKPIQFKTTGAGVFEKGPPQAQRQPGVFLVNGGPASPQQPAKSPTPAAASPQQQAEEDTSTDF